MATKHYCDRCGIELGGLKSYFKNEAIFNKVKRSFFYWINGHWKLVCHHYMLCNDCHQRFNDILSSFMEDRNE